MCTLIVGRDVPVTGSSWIAANRDEDPWRPSDPPGVLLDRPRLVGGRDRVAGGTWLAIRERRAVVAMLNRRPGAFVPSGDAAAALRSRGRLALATAAAVESQDGLARAALVQALRALAAARYAPFTLIYADAGEGFGLAHDGLGPPRVLRLDPGWHVVTHEDLDDPSEPRTAALLRDLRAWEPRTEHEVESGLAERLRLHGENGAPPVCIHEGRMVTVSASIVHLDPRGARYLHAEGRPCEHAFTDLTALLEGAAVGTSRPLA